VVMNHCASRADRLQPRWIPGWTTYSSHNPLEASTRGLPLPQSDHLAAHSGASGKLEFWGSESLPPVHPRADTGDDLYMANW
jgi:hypothetical protein